MKEARFLLFIVNMMSLCGQSLSDFENLINQRLRLVTPFSSISFISIMIFYFESDLYS